MRGSRNFCQLIESSAYFTVYRGVPMVLLLKKLYLYFTKDPESIHYVPGGGGGVQLFPVSSNADFYRNPYTYLLFSRGGCIPLWVRTWAMLS